MGVGKAGVISVNALLWIAGTWAVAVSGGLVKLMIDVSSLHAALLASGVIKGGG